MPDCPSDTDLAGFLNESFPPERIAGLSSHVDGCSDCQTRLDKLTHDADGAVARYKELSSIRSGVGSIASSPDAGTLVIGGNPLPCPPSARMVGLPNVPGFDVAAEIGRGGMGVVYKARHRRLNRLCALKMILAGGAADARTVQRFLYEAEILARVQHTQVVQVFEVDTYQGPSGVPIPYLAMELLEGGSLSRRVREAALPPRAAAELVEGLARAVHSAHAQGIIHRDLKPANILFPEAGTGHEPPDKATGSASTLTPSARRSTPKVTDFGLAKFIEAGADLTGSGQVVGTPHYMAPEQAAGSKQIGPPADVYALGAILFECLTGRPPFIGEEPMSVLLKVVNEQPPDVRSLRPDVPRDLAAVVARCLDKEPRRRYASADALADDLRRFLENRPTIARPLRRRERLGLWVKRNPAVTVLAGSLAIVLVVTFALITWLWLKAKQTALDEHHAKTLATLSEERATKAAAASAESLTEVKKQKTIAERWQAELEFGRAMNACEEGRIEDGLRQFLRAVELAKANGVTDLADAARINLAAWPRELPPARRPFPHKEQPRMAAFHPDGTHMVTAGRQRELYLWNIETAKKVRTYEPPVTVRPILGPGWDGAYWSVAISPDGKILATGGSDGRITFWNTNSPKSLGTFDAVGRGDNVWWVAFAPDGTLWAADGQTGVKQWDITAKPKPVVLTHLIPGEKTAGIVNVLAISADGKRVYTGDRKAVLREWDVANEALAQKWEADGWIQDIALSSDGEQVAATGPGGTAHLFERGRRDPVLEISLSGAYGNGVAFAPKQPFLVTSDGDGNVRFWHRGTGQPVGNPMRFSGEVLRPRFRPGMDEFAVAGGDSVYLCGVPEPHGELLSSGHSHRVRGMAFSPSGDTLAVTDDSILDLFQSRTRKLLHSAARVGIEPLCLAFDPNPARKWLYRGFRGGFDRLALPNGQKAEVIPSYGLGNVHAIEFSADGTAMFILGATMISRYDPATLELIVAKPYGSVLPPGTDFQTMAIRPDGAEVMLVFGRSVMFLNPKTLKPVRPGWTTREEILDAKYTPDSASVFVGRRDNIAELLDATTGAVANGVRSMPHARAVAAVAISPDGKTLLTGCRDGTARFWDAASGLPLGPPLRHHGPVSHVAFDPKGKYVVTGTGSGHVMTWDIPPAPAQAP